MALSPGDKLGPYEVLAPIGAGGMGEVYKARDTRLERTVAIKVLPDHIARRDDLRVRFEREARAVASLNHPHICVLHDIGPGYMVMDLIEGETLAARIEKGALPLDQAVKFAIQIADALDRAHRAGVTHRDVKPQNIMLTRDGVKVLDFGLAKSIAKPGPSEETLTAVLTTEGTIMGTPQYMAPEQFEGKEADARGDIWAFGAVLYEMVTGKKAFQGKSYGSLVGAILSADPAPMAVKPFTPAWLERLVRRCLAKDAEDRYQSMRDVVLELRTPPEETAAALTKASRWPWVVAGVFAAAALAVSIVHFRETKEDPRLLKVSVLPPEGAAFRRTGPPAVSPDGHRLAFVAAIDGNNQIWVRDLDSLTARALPGTADGSFPFWSPDSRNIGFFADGKLKKIDTAGGPALTLCDTGLVRGGTWSDIGTIVYSAGPQGMFRVPAAGGSATALSAPDKAADRGDHRYPWFLPDGRHFLYTSINGGQTAVYVADLESKERKRLLAAESNAVYSPPGHLLFVRERTLMAQPFDAGKLQTTGDAVPIAEQVDTGIGASLNQFSISRNGVLAYTSGSGSGGNQLTWFDRSGKVTGTLGEPDAASWGVISPDGKSVATDRRSQAVTDVWLHDLARGTASRFTFGPKTNWFPVWSPDGGRIAFYSTRDSIGHPFQRTTGGTAQDEILSKPMGEPPTNTRVEDWSRDGRYLILGAVTAAKTGSDIWVLPLNPEKPGEGKPFPYLQTEFREHYAKVSPDGRWLAYTSNESKRDEIFVQSFPERGGKWQVSTNGGGNSIWSRDGRELFYVSTDGKMMAVEIKGGAKFESGAPKPLFNVRLPGGSNAWFDVGKDGRFLIPIQPGQADNAPMTVVVNWQTGLGK